MSQSHTNTPNVQQPHIRCLLWNCFFFFTFELTRGDFYSDLHPDRYLSKFWASKWAHAMRIFSHWMHHIMYAQTHTHMHGVYKIHVSDNALLPLMNGIQFTRRMRELMKKKSKRKEERKRHQLMKMMPQNLVEINLFVILGYLTYICQWD